MWGSRRPKRFRFGPCSTRIFILFAPVGGVPVLFQVTDERGAEMALCLLASVQRHVAAKQVERLLPDAESSPVVRGAYHAGTRVLLHGFRRGKRRGQPARVPRWAGAARPVSPLHGAVRS